MELTKIAVLLRRLPFNGRAVQELYRVEPPMTYTTFEPVEEEYEEVEHTTEHVVVSAASVFGVPETYIFPANIEGKITDFGELPGSYRGGLNHEEALRRAGYEVYEVAR